MADEQTLSNQIENQTADDTSKNEEVKLTQSELDALLAKAKKEGETDGYVKGKTETKNRLTKQFEEESRLRDEETAKKLKFEKMSDLQKAETERDDARKELQIIKDELALKDQTEETRKIMKDKGLDDEVVDMVLVPKDAEATLARIDRLKVYLERNIQKGIEAKITTHVPRQNSVPEETGFTLEQARKTLKLK